MMASFTRRKFLEVLAVSASATALSGCPIGDRDNSGALFQLAPEFFPQSVASGDPRETSVIVWTRVQVTNADSADRSLLLQVATDADFKSVVVSQEFPAKSANDHCLKVRVTGLSADTYYYYRFVYRGERSYRSRTGRTKTAPAVSATRDVKFASVSCQDFVGRYFNPYLKLAAITDLDFIVHLGDYVYETTGDPRFQNATSTRKITFSDSAGAIAMGTEPNVFYAAQSLSNYRDLYKQYRSDAALQTAHEKFPFICIWDDHEFADDSFGATANASNARSNENSPERKQNAERAYYDYMPVDTELLATTSALEIDEATLYPNTMLNRDFHFGSHVHLLMTDFRSHRPDHIIPEDAFPGTVAVPQAALQALFTAQGIPWGAVSAMFSPYIDFAVAPWSLYQPVIEGALTQYYLSNGADATAAAAYGAALKATKLNAALAKQLVDAAIAAGAPVPAIDSAVFPGLERGLDYTLVGKTGVFNELGSRYFVVKPTYDILAGVMAQATGNAAQNAYGNTQAAWLQSTLVGSTARWKFFGSSVSMTSMVLDLTNPALGVPAPFNQKFYLNVDQWDGFPQARDTLIKSMQDLHAARGDGYVVLSGDIHANFATNHGGGVSEITSTSISSGTNRALLEAAVKNPPLSQVAGIDLLVAAVDSLVVQASRTTPSDAATAKIKYTNGNVNGVSVITAKADSVDVTMFEWNAYAAFTNNYATAAATINTAVPVRFVIDSDSSLSKVS